MSRKEVDMGGGNRLYDEAGNPIAVIAALEDLWTVDDTTITSADVAQAIGVVVPANKELYVTELTLYNPDADTDALVTLEDSEGSPNVKTTIVVPYALATMWGSGVGRRFTTGQYVKIKSTVASIRVSGSGVMRKTQPPV